MSQRSKEHTEKLQMSQTQAQAWLASQHRQKEADDLATFQKGLTIMQEHRELR